MAGGEIVWLAEGQSYRWGYALDPPTTVFGIDIKPVLL